MNFVIRLLLRSEHPTSTMKFLIVLAVVAAASADVSHVVNPDFAAPIVKQSYDITPESAFQYVYETGNGIVAQAQGVVKDPNSENPALEVKGSYSYKSPEGVPIDLTYIADENGYQPQGSHLPVAPPVPEAIARSLAYIASRPVEAVAKAGVVAANTVFG